MSEASINIIQGTNTFAGNILRAVADESPSSNVFLSPFSLSMSLTMAMLGAKSTTRNQMTQSLGFGNQSEKSICTTHSNMIAELNQESIGFANRIFVADKLPVSQDFNETLTNWYNVVCSTVSFATDPVGAANEINAWVKQATKARIPTLVSSDQLDPFTAMIIANAVHFKSAWVKEFDLKDTKNLPFYLDSQNVIQVKMMFQKASHRIMYHDDADCDILELRYKDQKTKMAIILPREIEGLNKVLSAFGPKMLDELESKADWCTTRVWLPVFKLEESYTLESILAQKLGMRNAFTSGLADFSGISSVPGDLYISQVVHKTFLEVNEEGTEAAAATAIRIMKRSLVIEEVVEFKANRPFLFAILDQASNNVLFAGVLRNPTASIDQTHSEL